jgi:hypothetical protein
MKRSIREVLLVILGYRLDSGAVSKAFDNSVPKLEELRKKIESGCEVFTLEDMKTMQLATAHIHVACANKNMISKWRLENVRK